MAAAGDKAETQPDGPAHAEPAASCPIVGIGASAGGLDALKRLLPKVAPDCGMAFVVVQHLAPDYKSILAELLGLSSSLPVTQVEGETSVEANHVYVIPPNAALTVGNGKLLLARPAHRNPVDEMLVSLARDQGENAAGIILSGTGSDGTVGLRAIKENGGLTVAQAEAEYDGMMRSALATGVVDFVLRAEEIPARLAAYFRHVTRGSGEKGRPSVASQAADQFNQITSLVRARTGHDFSGYKNGTIIRQVQRRMHVLQVNDVAGYIDRLRQDSREANLLFNDLLIGVTNFFRDQQCFAALEREVIPKLFENRAPDHPVRVWVPGCATGEEAYSIAMLLREHAPAAMRTGMQVFASDIDDAALETARVGRYAASIAKDVTPERLERHFVREDGTYRVHTELRELCLFSSHNLLRDAPFSKLDLLSCRNLLMYFTTELQDRVANLFHYALNPDGYLFLGTSENVTRQSRLFGTVNKSCRTFRRRMVPDRRVPEFPLGAPRSAGPPRLADFTGSAPPPSLRSLAERQLLDRFSPAYVIVSADGELLEASAATGKYLELPAGPPHTSIFTLARPALRVDIRAGLHHAVSTGRLTAQHKIVLGVNGGQQEVDIYVQPLRHGASSDIPYMIVFQDLGAIKPAPDADAPEPGEDGEEAEIRQLEAELRMTRERLQTTSEELESSNEELKSSNEELQSINEELQSTNEELETSKEELQSINEELQTVNAELNTRVEELSRANNDISNLLNSTQIATVFLDRTFTIKSFTPAAKDVFRLVDSDTGRPITHVRPRFEMEELQEDAERVLRTLSTIERPVWSNENATCYIMRILPYRTADNVIDGVVITFTDITRITAAEARINELTQEQRARLRDLEALLDLLPVGVMVCDTETGGGVQINAHGAHMIGAPDARKGFMPAEAPFRLFDGDAEVPAEQQPLQHAARTGESVHGWQGRLVDGAGQTLYVMISASPLFADDGRVKGAIAAVVDVSAHHAAQAHQRMLLDELQHRVKNVLATIASLATRMSRRQQSLEQFYDTFLSRLSAMGRVHDLLIGGAWSGAGIGPLVETVIQPYVNAQGTNVKLSGDPVTLRPTAATTLGMVLYELATNSAKYGAWSRPGGRVEVAWKSVAPDGNDPRVRIVWKEHADVTPQAPDKPGFGTTFITRSVEYEMSGTAVLDFAPEGVRCTIEFPVAGNLQQPPNQKGNSD